MDFMIWAELEVVDRFGAIKRGSTHAHALTYHAVVTGPPVPDSLVEDSGNGGTHLATLLADCAACNLPSLFFGPVTVSQQRTAFTSSSASSRPA